jgi:hypothetical protein
MRFRDGGGNTTSDTTDTIILDSVHPTVTINQDGAQSDPTNGSTIDFAVVFSESVTGFATGDVTLSGTAGATTGTVTGSGTTYNVAVTGMTGTGTVIATIASSKAIDAAGNGNTASTSTDNTVTYDVTNPTGTITAITTPRNTALGTITGTSDDNIEVASVTVVIREGSGCSTSWSVSNTPSLGDMVSGKTYTVFLLVYDTAGNHNNWNVNQSVFFDNTGPTGSITNSSGNPTNDDTPTLTLTIVDTGVGISGAEMRFSCDNATWTSFEAYSATKSNFDINSGSNGCSTSDGSRTVYVQYQDSLNNIGSSYPTTSFILDTAAPSTPTIACTGFTSNVWANAAYPTCSWNATGGPSTETHHYCLN